MHRIDLAPASGAPAELEPAVALDSVLELLDFLPHMVAFSPGVVELRGDGETIALRATDFDGVGTITLTPTGFTVARDVVVDAHVTMTGSVNDLALVISRRLDPDDPRVTMTGRSELVYHWIEHSALG